ARQQDDGEGHLGNYQDAAHPLSTRAHARAPATLLKRGDQFNLRTPPRRQGAEQNSRGNGNAGGEDQQGAIDGGRAAFGNARRNQLAQKAGGQHRQAKPDNPSGAGEQQALCQHLFDRPFSTGAQRQPYRQLGGPRAAPRQQKIAIFAQAISRSKATAPSRTSSAGRTSPA